MTRRDVSSEKIQWLKSLPFLALHAGCLLVFLCGVSWAGVAVCAVSYIVRVFAVTAGYHRYLSHRSYKMGRVFQFILACIGTSATQKGPLWWAANHRHHHAHSDTEKDAHSPRRGFWWSHVGWFLCDRFSEPDWRLIRDLAGYPELRFLNTYYVIPPVVLAGSLCALGGWLNHAAPSLRTSALQMLVWGYVISTVLLYHATFAVNSLAHVFGRQRYHTGDDSRNNALIALFTFGEGWHNNHHYAPSSERLGFFWWEIDLGHYVLVLLSWIGLVSQLKAPPERVYEREATTGTIAGLRKIRYSTHQYDTTGDRVNGAESTRRVAVLTRIRDFRLPRTEFPWQYSLWLALLGLFRRRLQRVRTGL